MTPEYFGERIASDLRHHFLAIRTVAPDMIAAVGSSIIDMGSNSWWEADGVFLASDDAAMCAANNCTVEAGSI